jgi:MFS family permease
LTTFVISYGVNQLGLSSSLMLIATLIGAALEIFVLLAFGRIADRVTPARVCLYGGVLSAIVAFPVFWAISTREPALVIIAVTIGIGCLSIPYAVYGSLITQMFPLSVRYSGVAISYNLGGVVSGFVPLIATAWLAAAGGHFWAPALLLVILALLTAIGGFWGGRMQLGDEVRAGD